MTMSSSWSIEQDCAGKRSDEGFDSALAISRARDVFLQCDDVEIWMAYTHNSSNRPF